MGGGVLFLHLRIGFYIECNYGFSSYSEYVFSFSFNSLRVRRRKRTGNGSDLSANRDKKIN